ncbi:Trafficking protein particle complex subunit 11 [Clonorchis sinensis]|uniref:Trafficking protein particle complex subunit 11 n=1 Tax=Clonorchis sinensis TaxID=79923 RepID=A0A8T1ME77_CLOSI|nr:Trafficking protein particle complex subunit 11 [Clonorchis sinensis]
MQHIENLPPELCCKPEPFVVLSGLDIETSSVHRSIWRAFTANRSRDRDPFKFRCRPINHVFPKPKLKPAGAYDWFLPKGLLKTGWMRKHLEEIPAMVAVFFDLDWDDRNWDERSVECAQRVDTVRSKLAGRDIKLVVILIQKRAPLPLGEDLNAMERAQTLCTKCDLAGKNLFVLSHTNLLYGCITRLESEFRDMAANYYHQRAKRVKAHKDGLNKASHQLLFVRYEFKIAFFGELKQDQALALKHYQQAYTHLLEQRMIDIHLLEVKTVAAFINYKICRLAFQTNASEAISQFRRHIEFFSGLVGMPQVAFEHEAWMSRQFEILGDLFQEAIQLSLTALMTQHPGLYYQEAARHAIARRQLCQTLCTAAANAPETAPDPEPNVVSSVSESPDLTLSEEATDTYSIPSTSTSPQTDRSKPKRMTVTDAMDFVRAQSPLRFARRVSGSASVSPNVRSMSTVLPPYPDVVSISATEKVDGLEFYGQRPWRQGVQSIEPPNMAKEQEGIRLLQKAELGVVHSELIIPLLEQTHLQYKRYKAERMKLYPSFLMGAEYFQKGNYAKALSCYLSIVDEYRREKWWQICTDILQHILKCSYMTGLIETFLSTALELIGPETLLAFSDKQSLQLAVFQLLQGMPPDPIFFMPELTQIPEETTALWTKHLRQLLSATVTDQPELAVVSTPPGTDQTTVVNEPRVEIDVCRLAVCVECKVAFARPQNTLDQPIQLAVFFRSHAPFAFNVRRVQVDFVHYAKSDGLRSDKCKQWQSSESWNIPFQLERTDVAKVLLFSLDAHSLGQRLRVDTVRVELGRPSTDTDQPDQTKEVYLSLVWQLSNSAEDSLESNPGVEPSAKSPARKGTPASKSYTPPSIFGLWNEAKLPSAPERHYQHEPVTVICPKTGVPIEIPAFPPTWDLLGNNMQTEIRERESKLEVNLVHTSPALTQEIYAVQCHVRNTESIEATHVTLSVSLTRQPAVHSSEDTSVGDSVHRELRPRGLKEPDQISINDPTPLESHKRSGANIGTSTTQLSDLAPNEHTTCTLFLRCANAGPRSLRCQLNYRTSLLIPFVPHSLSPSLDQDVACSVRLQATDDQSSSDSKAGRFESQCAKVALTEINVSNPFRLTWQTLSILQAPISDLIVGEDFILQLHLTNTSPWDLEVLSTRFKLSETVVFSDGHQDVQIKDLCVQAECRVTECQILTVSRLDQENGVVNLGQYEVSWRRKSTTENPDSALVLTTSFDLFSCTVLELPVRVRADIPTIGTVLTPLPVLFVLENQTIYPQEVLIQLEPSPSFMFSGQHKLRLRVLPGSPQTLRYLFLPLFTGYLVIPRLRISLTRVDGSGPGDEQTLKLHMEERMLRQIPTRMFVVPSETTSAPQAAPNLLGEQPVPVN